MLELASVILESPYTPLFAISIVSILVLFFYIRHICRPTYFYIIRHGETLLNQQHVKQGPEGALSLKGQTQALQVGTALLTHRIQKIYTSPYERAVETATLIQQSLKCPIETVDVLRERKNPSEVLGKKTDDPEVVRITGRTAYGYHEDAYRYSDEENFVDLCNRARACEAFLSHIREKRVVVVTHHAFLQLFLSYLLYRDRLHAEEYVKLAFYNPALNAGITLCVYHPWHGKFSSTRGWEIQTYSQPIEMS